MGKAAKKVIPYSTVIKEPMGKIRFSIGLQDGEALGDNIRERRGK